MLRTVLLLTTCLAMTANLAHADKVELNELSWIDKKYFDKQRQVIDDLGRENFGQRLRGGPDDIKLMQRILDAEKITIFESDIHKAFGVVLGDVYVTEHGWQWREYKDKLGRTRGVCIPKTEHCVFPLSMMSRRLRVTTELDMAEIYQRGLDFLAEQMPKTPYSTEQATPKQDEPQIPRRAIVVPYR